jgi:cell division protein FtsI (penicillin-binding protein 3)
MKQNWVNIRIVILATVVGVACAGSVTARLVYLQVEAHEYYAEKAKDQRQRIRKVIPRRGDIHDRNGNKLALSVAADMVIARPVNIANPAATAHILAPILNMSESALRKKLSGDRRYIRLAKEPLPAQSAAVRSLLGQADMAGIELEPRHQRVYPNGALAAHALGFVRLDGDPGAGLEVRYNDEIHGADGRAIEWRDALGYVFDQRTLQEPQPGNDLTLTLDLKVQHVLEEELAHAARKAGARAGAAIAMDPRTGEILASASWPEFNPNKPGDATPDQHTDHVVVAAYEPGSTFKIITAAAALEQSKVSPREVIHCNNGYIMIGRKRLNDHKSFADLTFTDIMALSSNVGSIKVGLRLEKKLFHETIRTFGFGQSTGSGLAGEQRGLLRAPDKWSALSQPSLSMGQEILVTPLQMLAAVSAVANDGVAMNPWVVRSLHNNTTQQDTLMTPPDPRRVISTRTARTLTRILEEVVEDGTGKAAAVPGYRVAGKTGTAQVAGRNGTGYLPDKYIASFVGYAPARDPHLAAIFVIKEPTVKAYHGGDVAAPAFGRFAARVLPGLGAVPDRTGGPQQPGRLTMGTGSGAVRPAAMRQPSSPRPWPHTAAGVMPDLSGRSLRQAVALLTDLGINPVLQGQGHVLTQEPPAGAPLPTGTEGCRLWLGRR